MRARDEGSADLGRIPAGYHAKAERLFGFDVTRRKILHGMLSVGVRDGSNEGEVFSFRNKIAVRSAVAGEPGKVRKYGCNQIAVMRVGSGEFRGV